MIDASAPMTELQLRVRAAQATLREFEKGRHKLGERDCVRMIAAHMRRCGHQVALPPTGAYRTIRQAKQLLAERGFADLYEALDAHGLERIAPAAAYVGDIIALPAMDELGCLTIKVGDDRVVGYHEAAFRKGAIAMRPLMFVAAWRVPIL